MDGDDFSAFLETLHHGYEDTRTVTEFAPPMQLNFGYWVLLEKLLLQCYDTNDMRLLAKWNEFLCALASRFFTAFDLFYGARRFFVSTRPQLGWVPWRAKIDDRIFIFQGSRIPFVARSIDDQGWEYIGPCYVHGLMSGEAWRQPKDSWWYMNLV